MLALLQNVYHSNMVNVLALKPFIVEVTFDAECRMFVAACDELHLCTEAPSFETLTERVWEIAPDMAQENGLHIAPQNLRLRFAFDQDFTDHRIAL